MNVKAASICRSAMQQIRMEDYTKYTEVSNAER